MSSPLCICICVCVCIWFCVCICICSETLLFALISCVGIEQCRILPTAFTSMHLSVHLHIPPYTSMHLHVSPCTSLHLHVPPPSLFATFVIPLFFSPLRREGSVECLLFLLANGRSSRWCWKSGRLLFCFHWKVKSLSKCFHRHYWVLKSLSLRMLCCTLIKPDDSAA